MSVCVFVRAMLCTTSTVQSYTVHHRPALCTTDLRLSVRICGTYVVHHFNGTDDDLSFWLSSTTKMVHNVMLSAWMSTLYLLNRFNFFGRYLKNKFVPFCNAFASLFLTWSIQFPKHILSICLDLTQGLHCDSEYSENVNDFPEMATFSVVIQHQNQ